MIPIGKAADAGKLTFWSGAAIVAKEGISTAAGEGTAKITMNVTGNQTASMLAGMMASGLTASGLNKIDGKFKISGFAEGSKSGKNVPRTTPQGLTQDGQVPAIGKMKDLNTPGNVVDGEFKVADYLPDMGNPKDNWHQNSGILRSIMREGVPIKDVSMFPMDNAGFLGAERNLLQSSGWTYLDGYWYPPQ